MDAFLAYVLGLLTVLVILIPLILLAQNNSGVSSFYSSLFCSNLAPQN